MTGLLRVDRTRRLGCAKHGTSEVRSHPFFSTIDFDALRDRKLTPPYVPTLKGAFDFRNYAETATATEPLSSANQAKESNSKLVALSERMDTKYFPDFDSVIASFGDL